MHRFIALLRGINVSGQKKIPMAELSKLFKAIGCEQVKTYIQSGNVVFSHRSLSCKILQDQIFNAILDVFGFDVMVLVKRPEELRVIFQRNPFVNRETETGKLYFVFLSQTPDRQLLSRLQQETFTGEAFAVTNECVYLLCYNGMGKARLNNNLIEQRLKVSATTRNYRTVLKLLEMSGV